MFYFKINQATNLLDLSQLYGTSTDNIRTYQSGQLNGPETLPINTNKNQCINPDYNHACYKSGDTRVNSNPYVTVLYTIFLRSHNNIAKQLKVLNEKWSDEKLYQTARKINIEIYQRIVYEEWMKIVLGENVANSINNENFRATTDKENDGVSNEFATAAIRFYNSMMPGDVFIGESGLLDGNAIYSSER